ncbi:hypothetical protein RRG08_064993 [Elysia crispata]|uniref:Uncharacterized protein n=1 Tax=Elysia crispata TaxID=231223 RepID=A0AAE0Y9Q8_9GAST|nr:hypothetical protein RRG08_064993 [Elysia crispata]
MFYILSSIRSPVIEELRPGEDNSRSALYATSETLTQISLNKLRTITVELSSKTRTAPERAAMTSQTV